MSDFIELTDGAFVEDDFDEQVESLLGAFFSGTEVAAGATANIFLDPVTTSAAAEGDVEGVASIALGGVTLTATIAMEGQPPPSVQYEVFGFFVDDDGQVEFELPHGVFVGRTGEIVADRTLASTIQLADVTTTATADAGAIGRSLTVNVTLADVTVVAAAGPLQQAALAATLDAVTTAATAEVKRILLTASGDIVLGAQAAIQLAGVTLSAQAQVGGNVANITLDDITVSGAIAESRVRASAVPNLEGVTVVATAVAMSPSIRWVELYMRRASGASAAPTTVKWAWWDQQRPDVLEQPADRGIAVIDEAGTCRIVLAGSTLAPGSVGYIAVSDTDGSPDEPWKQFSGPIRVR